VRLTYVDASVLIMASRENSIIFQKALQLLGDPERTFAASGFLKLEVIPQAAYLKRLEEVAFYEAFFAGVSVWAKEEGLVSAAMQEASTYGLHAMDALHIAAAAQVGAEFVTVESLRKPIHRTKSVKVTFLG